jgi:hypothetical protein
MHIRRLDAFRNPGLVRAHETFTATKSRGMQSWNAIAVTT